MPFKIVSSNLKAFELWFTSVAECTGSTIYLLFSNKNASYHSNFPSCLDQVYPMCVCYLIVCSNNEFVISTQIAVQINFMCNLSADGVYKDQLIMINKLNAAIYQYIAVEQNKAGNNTSNISQADYKCQNTTKFTILIIPSSKSTDNKQYFMYVYIINTIVNNIYHLIHNSYSRMEGFSIIYYGVS